MTDKQVREARVHRERLQVILDSGLVADTSQRAALRMEVNRLTRELPAEKENGRRAGRPSLLRNRLKNLVALILSQMGVARKEA